MYIGLRYLSSPHAAELLPPDDQNLVRPFQTLNLPRNPGNMSEDTPDYHRVVPDEHAIAQYRTPPQTTYQSGPTHRITPQASHEHVRLHVMYFSRSAVLSHTMPSTTFLGPLYLKVHIRVRTHMDPPFRARLRSVSSFDHVVYLV